MNHYNRYTEISYLTHSIRLKLKTLMSKGKSPFPESVTPIYPVTNFYTFNDFYHSFSYFTYEQAKRYYKNSDALISEIIVALCYFNEYGNNESFAKKAALILNKLTVEGDCIVYRHSSEYDKFKMKKGSISGITQAKLASLFLRANLPDEAKKCLNACLLDQENNGPFRKMNKDMSWIEEYPSDELTMVLNGHIFNLIALIEYSISTRDSSFDDLLHQCMTATLSYLPHYWYGTDLLYSLHNWDYCNIHYMGIMTFQLEHLHEISGIHEFRLTAHRIRAHCNWSIFNKLIGTIA